MDEDNEISADGERRYLKDDDAPLGQNRNYDKCLFADCTDPGEFEVRFRFDFFGKEKEWQGKLCASHHQTFMAPTHGLSIHGLPNQGDNHGT